MRIPLESGVGDSGRVSKHRREPTVSAMFVRLESDDPAEQQQLDELLVNEIESTQPWKAAIVRMCSIDRRWPEHSGHQLPAAIR